MSTVLYTVNWYRNWHLFPHLLRKTSKLLVHLRASLVPIDNMPISFNSSFSFAIMMLASKDILISDNLYPNKTSAIQLFWHHIAYSKRARGCLSSSVVLEEGEERAWTERKAPKSLIWPHHRSLCDQMWIANSVPLRPLWGLFMAIQKGTPRGDGDKSTFLIIFTWEWL